MPSTLGRRFARSSWRVDADGESGRVMMQDDDELKPGVDKPKRGQYVIGVLVILLLSALAYWRLG
jgi:hypothetical protein